MRLFLEKGYEATTIEEIAAAAETSPSTFFNYFPSKEDVVFQDAELVDQIAQLLATRVGRGADDFALRNLAGALLGVMMSAMLVAAEQPKADLMTLVGDALAHLDAGLPLIWPPKD